MDSLGLHIDGSRVDEFSYVVAVIWAVARYAKRRRKPLPRSAKKVHPLKVFFSRETVGDFSGGVGIFPLCGLAASLFSDPLLAALVSGNRLTLSVAGVSALFSVLRDF